MFEVTNISNNPLLLSDNKMLAAGATKKLETIGKREKDYQTRGMFLIFEEKPAETTAPKTEGGKSK